MALRCLDLTALLLVAAACKETPNQPAAPIPSARSTPAAGSAPATTASPDATPAADATLTADATPADDGAATPSAAAPGCEGWRAAKVEHMGMGHESVTAECARGKARITTTLVGARDFESTKRKKLTRAAWNQLWQELETAGWRTLAPTCPPVSPPPETFYTTELELTISDGKTTKQVTCDGPNVVAVHEAIMAALDTAAE